MYKKLFTCARLFRLLPVAFARRAPMKQSRKHDGQNRALNVSAKYDAECSASQKGRSTLHLRTPKKRFFGKDGKKNLRFRMNHCRYYPSERSSVRHLQSYRRGSGLGADSVQSFDKKKHYR